jgi:hypothetical protein
MAATSRRSSFREDSVGTPATEANDVGTNTAALLKLVDQLKERLRVSNCKICGITLGFITLNDSSLIAVV